jgi:hypothetical protein
MPQSVRAVLSLWNDVAADRVGEYESWHTLEHVPERVWVPGFVAGTRYVAADPGTPRYFTLYELEGLDCLQGAAYRDLVANPTPWSASMRPSLAGFLRKAGPVVASTGHVLANALTVTRLVWPAGRAPGRVLWQAVAERALAAAAGPGATRVRIQQVEAAGPQALANVDDAPPGAEFVVLLDHVAEAMPVSQPGVARQAIASCGAAAPLWWREATFRLASQVRHDDVAAAARPAPRIDLMPHPTR